MLTKKKKLIILINVLLLIFAATFTMMKNNRKRINEENNKSNNGVITINKEYDLNGITITNVNLFTNETGSNFTAKITNTSGKDININYLTVIFYDKDHNPVIEKYFLQHVSLAKDNVQFINLYNDSELQDMIDVKFEIEYEKTTN